MIPFVWWSFAMALAPLALGLLWRLITAMVARPNPDSARPGTASAQRA